MHSPILNYLGIGGSAAPPSTRQAVALVVAMLLGALASSGHTALELSPDYRKYRKYYSLFGWKTGRWQQLPPVVRVTLKYFATSSRHTSKYTWGSAVARHEELVVMLSIKNSATGLIIGTFSLDDVNPAIDFARDTAEHLGVPINKYLPLS